MLVKSCKSCLLPLQEHGPAKRPRKRMRRSQEDTQEDDDDSDAIVVDDSPLAEKGASDVLYTFQHLIGIPDTSIYD